MNPENRKQILIIILALGAGIVATAMTAGYVQNRIEAERAILTQQLNKKQQEFAQEQQRSQKQIDALVGEINKLSQQQEQIRQQAITAAQQAAAAAATPRAAEKVRKSSLALRTPPGKRAVTVKFDSLAAVGGLVDPGDFVDVIAQLEMPGKIIKGKEKKEPVTVMIFQHLQILAVNTNLDEKGIYDDQQAANSLKITLAVAPQEAGLMAFAEKNGKLQLTLRSPTEQNKEKLKTPTWKTLAEYILQTHGENINLKGQDEEVPVTDEKKTAVEAVDVKEAKPYIQIFRAGKEL